MYRLALLRSHLDANTNAFDKMFFSGVPDRVLVNVNLVQLRRDSADAAVGFAVQRSRAAKSVAPARGGVERSAALLRDYFVGLTDVIERQNGRLLYLGMVLSPPPGHPQPPPRLEQGDDAAADAPNESEGDVNSVWDAVAFVVYPSLGHYAQVLRQPHFEKIKPLRRAAVQRSVLFACSSTSRAIERFLAQTTTTTTESTSAVPHRLSADRTAVAPGVAPGTRAVLCIQRGACVIGGGGDLRSWPPQAEPPVACLQLRGDLLLVGEAAHASWRQFTLSPARGDGSDAAVTPNAAATEGGAARRDVLDLVSLPLAPAELSALNLVDLLSMNRRSKAT